MNLRNNIDEDYKKQLDKLGYEYKMIYINTSLENAQKRNELRARKLPKEVVAADWENAQKNVKQYKSIFGRNFIEVRNDDTKQDFEAKADKLFGRLQAWSTSFPSNKVAIKWKTAQLDAKKR